MPDLHLSILDFLKFLPAFQKIWVCGLGCVPRGNSHLVSSVEQERLWIYHEYYQDEVVTEYE